MTVTTTEPVKSVTSTVTKPKPVVTELDETATSVHKRIEEILKEFKHQETDIPLNHHYWYLLNQYRRLRNEEKENV